MISAKEKRSEVRGERPPAPLFSGISPLAGGLLPFLIVLPYTK